MALPPGFDQTATVYSRNASTGRYTTVLRSNLGCRLAHLNRTSTVTGPQRTELAGIRLLLWDPAYAMPETAQVEVSGVTGPDGVTAARWNIRTGTLASMRGPTGTAMYRQADVTRAT
jgi:hypothetical protein